MKNIYIYALAISTLFTSCGTSEKQKNITVVLSPIPVQVEKLNMSSQANELTFSGRIQALDKANLSTRLMGQIDQVHTQVGDQVKKGQVLIRISDSDLKAKKAGLLAQKKQATAMLTNIEKNKQRLEILLDQKSATQKQVDDIHTQYEVTLANIATINQGIREIETNIAYATIKAPFDGFVASRTANVGDIASPGMPLLSLVSKQFKAVITIPETEILNLKEGQTVQLSVPALQEKVDAKITQIAASGAYSSGQFEVSVVPTEKIDGLKDGLFAQASISNQESRSLLIDEKHLIERGQLTGVYTLSQQNTAILNWLRLGKTVDGKRVVLSGINAGETIITTKHADLQDGSPVAVQ